MSLQELGMSEENAFAKACLSSRFKAVFGGG
jgi:hypothetical protein